MIPDAMKILLSKSGFINKIIPRENIIIPEANFNNLPCHSDSFLPPSVITNINRIINNGIT